MNKNYTNYYYKSYNPKKAVKSFQDLDVYQKALEASVFAGKTIIGSKSTKKNKKIVSDFNDYIIKNMAVCAFSIPHLIAEAHSCRFGQSNACLIILDKVMLNCNKMVVYLEQVRDICETNIDHDQFEDQIKKYLWLRRKVLNLQRVWRKYIQIACQNQSKTT
ncbi:hypothetical protein KKF64_01690 [Patescibacteria group bacterium]|nr:hypothetical protein [Patescibacteria group bacterium]